MSKLICYFDSSAHLSIIHFARVIVILFPAHKLIAQEPFHIALFEKVKFFPISAVPYRKFRLNSFPFAHDGAFLVRQVSEPCAIKHKAILVVVDEVCGRYSQLALAPICI